MMAGCGAWLAMESLHKTIIFDIVTGELVISKGFWKKQTVWLTDICSFSDLGYNISFNTKQENNVFTVSAWWKNLDILIKKLPEDLPMSRLKVSISQYRFVVGVGIAELIVMVPFFLLSMFSSDGDQETALIFLVFIILGIGLILYGKLTWVILDCMTGEVWCSDWYKKKTYFRLNQVSNYKLSNTCLLLYSAEGTLLRKIPIVMLNFEKFYSLLKQEKDTDHKNTSAAPSSSNLMPYEYNAYTLGKIAAFCTMFVFALIGLLANTMAFRVFGYVLALVSMAVFIGIFYLSDKNKWELCDGYVVESYLLWVFIWQSELWKIPRHFIVS